MTEYHEIAEWHRRLCPIAPQIIISGDLSEDATQALMMVDTSLDGHPDRVGDV